MHANLSEYQAPRCRVLAYIYLQVQQHLHLSMADESMADEFKVEESMADMAYVIP